MLLNIIIDDYSMNLEVPDEIQDSLADSIDRLDRSMDRGFQLGREWLERPDLRQRCQLAADKLLTALETDNKQMAILSASYILNKLPDTRRVRIDNSGEMQGTLFE